MAPSLRIERRLSVLQTDVQADYTNWAIWLREAESNHRPRFMRPGWDHSSLSRIVVGRRGIEPRSDRYERSVLTIGRTALIMVETAGVEPA